MLSSPHPTFRWGWAFSLTWAFWVMRSSGLLGWAALAALAAGGLKGYPLMKGSNGVQWWKDSAQHSIKMAMFFGKLVIHEYKWCFLDGAGTIVGIFNIQLYTSPIAQSESSSQKLMTYRRNSQPMMAALLVDKLFATLRGSRLAIWAAAVAS